MSERKKNILIVCQWPLGGIRTYLKYNYHHFPRDRYNVTLLACPTIERDTLTRDMREENIDVLWARPVLGYLSLIFWIIKTLLGKKYDLIHSQGFISAINVSIANRLFRKRHVLTIHGILEKKFLEGKLRWLKTGFIAFALREVAVFHGVSKDILDHFESEFPGLRKRGKWIVINNGINVEPFLSAQQNAAIDLRQKLHLDNETMIFGFFGRFMPQKGFNYIIDAVNMIRVNRSNKYRFVVLAVGSGDMIREYKYEIERLGLDHFFEFIPFDPDISKILKGCDFVLMPSIWEAWGLLACEALCAGVPLIASDCIGLREVIKDTPTFVVKPHDPDGLADCMINAMMDNSARSRFMEYKLDAARRFDVRYSAEQLVSLFDECVYA